MVAMSSPSVDFIHAIMATIDVYVFMDHSWFHMRYLGPCSQCRKTATIHPGTRRELAMEDSEILIVACGFQNEIFTSSR